MSNVGHKWVVTNGVRSREFTLQWQRYCREFCTFFPSSYSPSTSQIIMIAVLCISCSNPWCSVLLYVKGCSEVQVVLLLVMQWLPLKSEAPTSSGQETRWTQSWKPGVVSGPPKYLTSMYRRFQTQHRRYWDWETDGYRPHWSVLGSAASIVLFMWQIQHETVPV